MLQRYIKLSDIRSMTSGELARNLCPKKKENGKMLLTKHHCGTVCAYHFILMIFIYRTECLLKIVYALRCNNSRMKHRWLKVNSLYFFFSPWTIFSLRNKCEISPTWKKKLQQTRFLRETPRQKLIFYHTN